MISNARYATPERLRNLNVGYINLYAYPDGAAYWGKPHGTRRSAENAARWCGWDAKRVVARCRVIRKLAI